MQYFRSFVFSTIMIISIIIFTLLNLGLFFIPYHKRSIINTWWAKLMIKCLDIICGLRVEFVGLKNIPETPCIIFSKHQSTLETIALQIYFNPQVWVLKKELLKIPFFGWSLALSKPIAIDRSSGKKAIDQIVQQGIDRLKKKLWLIIFPEGTRTRPGDKPKYKAGGAILAEKSGYDILPIAHNAGYFWPKGQFYKKPGVVKIVIGEVIKNDNKNSKELLQEAEQWIEGEVAKFA